MYPHMNMVPAQYPFMVSCPSPFPSTVDSSCWEWSPLSTSPHIPGSSHWVWFCLTFVLSHAHTHMQPVYPHNYADPSDLSRYPVSMAAYYPSASDPALVATMSRDHSSSSFGMGGVAEQSKFSRSSDGTSTVASQQQSHSQQQGETGAACMQCTLVRFVHSATSLWSCGCGRVVM